MCHWGVVLVCLIIATVKSETESIEDTRPYTFSFSNPSALNFQDIYTSIVTSAEDTSKTVAMEDEPSTTTDDGIYLLSKERSQFVEFHPELTVEPATLPPPKYILNSTFLQRKAKLRKSSTTTEEPDDIIRVTPIKNIQRGVLDLLFPESRVKSFKNIFNSLKRMLSHTFRR